MNDRSDIVSIRNELCNPRDVAHRLGLKGKPEGAGFKVICPAHGDRTPSCSLTRGPDGTLRINCFGCDLAGDIFSLVAATERLDLSRDFPAVLESAARYAGITLTTRGSRGDDYVPHRMAPLPPMPVGLPPLDDTVFDALVRPLLWTGTLDRSSIAFDVTSYLDSRGLLDLARADGWAALPAPEYQGQWIRSMIDEHGADVVARSGLVYAPLDGEPDFRSFVHSEARLVIPWRDAAGTVTTLQRRRLDGGKPKYVFATGRQPRDPYGVHHLASAHPGATVAFCEGAIDQLALTELRRRDGGNEVILGIPGVAAWSKDRGMRWAALASGRVGAVALDADGAGAKAVDGMIRDLSAAGTVDVLTWTPDGAKDWADVLKASNVKAVA